MKRPTTRAGWAILIIVLANAVLAQGCGQVRSRNTPQIETSGGLPYENVLSRWTDQGKVYSDDGMDLLFYVRGTYFSEAFRQAYHEKYAWHYGLSPTEARRILNQEAALSGQGHEFLLAVSGLNKKATDLTSNDPAWKIYLECGTCDRVEPFDIRPIKKNSSRLEAFFPYISPWSKVYRIRFFSGGPASCSDACNLILTGVFGQVRLVYPSVDGHAD